jgi:hypothetical protein
MVHPARLQNISLYFALWAVASDVKIVPDNFVERMRLNRPGTIET